MVGAPPFPPAGTCSGCPHRQVSPASAWVHLPSLHGGSCDGDPLPTSGRSSTPVPFSGGDTTLTLWAARGATQICPRGLLPSLAEPCRGASPAATSVFRGGHCTSFHLGSPVKSSLPSTEQDAPLSLRPPPCLGRFAVPCLFSETPCWRVAEPSAARWGPGGGALSGDTSCRCPPCAYSPAITRARSTLAASTLTGSSLASFSPTKSGARRRSCGCCVPRTNRAELAG